MRVLVAEPNGDVRSLIEIVVRRLGHEPVLHDDGAQEALAVDAAVLEPGVGDGLALARTLFDRRVPMVFASIFPAEPETLDLDPVAYFVKPFSLYGLARALTAALARADELCASEA
jgi:CheY-like chemotaxis protein